MFVFSYTKKWLDNLERDQADIERRSATTQSFSGRIRVNPDRLYVDSEQQERIRDELRALKRK